jgi:ferredoxin
MIVTEQKAFAELIDSISPYTRIFLVGCGECATTCKTGGEEECRNLARELEKNGKTVVGFCVPKAPCVASQTKAEFAKHMKELRQAEAVIVLACGLGVQSAKENDRLGLTILPGCNSLFGATVDGQGNFHEKCSLCGACVLQETGGICPVTLCAKGLLNGPCGGMDKGKCEVDKEKDCAWVLIYRDLEKKQKISNYKKIHQPRNFEKSGHPRTVIMEKKNG